MRIALVLLSLMVISTAHAQERKSSDISKRVTTHLERGIEFYAEKQYELAIVEFRAGFALDPRPDFLFALAQAERLSGDCPTAVIYYKRFLATEPDTDQAEAARVNMKRCTRALESGPDGRPLDPADEALAEAENAAPPVSTPVPETTGTSKTVNRGPPWYRDKIGTSLLAGSAVSAIVSIGFWFSKGAAENDATAAAAYEDYASAIDRARRARTISIVTLSLGAALAGASVYRYKTRGSREAQLVATPTQGGGAIALVGRF